MSRLTIFTIAMLFAAAGATPAQETTPALIAAAAKEGKVVWYTSVDVKVAEAVAKAFQALTRESGEVRHAVEGRSRARAERGQNPAHTVLDGRDASVGEGRGDPAHDLAVFGPLVRAHKDDRIAGRGLGAIGLVEQLEPGSEQALAGRKGSHGSRSNTTFGASPDYS